MVCNEMSIDREFEQFLHAENLHSTPALNQHQWFKAGFADNIKDTTCSLRVHGQSLCKYLERSNVKRIRERKLGSTWLRRDKNRIRTILKDKTQSYWDTKKVSQGRKIQRKRKGSF